MALAASFTSLTFMTIDLSLYSKIKDKCCIAYLGNSEEYLYQLSTLRGNIEAQMPGLTVYIAARDISFHHIQGLDNILKESELQTRKLDFGFIHEILCDVDNHPVAKLLDDSGVAFLDLHNECPAPNDRCLIVPNGAYPTRNLTDAQTQQLMDLAVSRGLKPEFGDDPTGVGQVYGVECWQLWKHCSQVAQKGSVLVVSGNGTKFFSTNFPCMEVYSFESNLGGVGIHRVSYPSM